MDTNIVPIKTKSKKKKSKLSCMHIRDKHILSSILQSDLKQMYGMIEIVRADIAALIQQDMLCQEGKDEIQSERLKSLLEIAFFVEDLHRDLSSTIRVYVDHLPARTSH